MLLCVFAATAQPRFLYVLSADHGSFHFGRYQIWTAWTNLSAPESALDPTATTKNTLSYAGPTTTRQPIGTHEVSLEGMLASAPVTPNQEKRGFSFSTRRGSAQSNASSLGPVAEERGEVALDMTALDRV